MPMNSVRTYQILKGAAQGWLKKTGFRACTSSGSRWERALADNLVVVLLFQCDKNGWTWHGSKFTLNLLLNDPRKQKGPLAQMRYGKLIDAADGKVWVTLTNRVVDKLQRVKQPPLADGEYPELRAYLLSPFTDFSAADDPWMRYYDEKDVTMWWVEFLEPRIHKMIENLLSLRS